MGKSIKHWRHSRVYTFASRLLPHPTIQLLQRRGHHHVKRRALERAADVVLEPHERGVEGGGDWHVGGGGEGRFIVNLNFTLLGNSIKVYSQ